ncbi:FtsX-like permease family protein [Nonomuraea antimicrobica]
MRWLSPVTLTAQGVIDSVPGFYSSGQFLLVPREVLPWPAANTLLIKGDAAPAELARLVPSATVETQQQALAAIRADPLTGTVSSTLLVVTVALGAYALAAIVLSLVIGAPDRVRAVSLLRTLGLSDRQARRLTVLELLPMVLVTALVGLGLGLVLPGALGPGVDMASYAGGLPVGDYSPACSRPWRWRAGWPSALCSARTRTPPSAAAATSAPSSAWVTCCERAVAVRRESAGQGLVRNVGARYPIR